MAGDMTLRVCQKDSSLTPALSRRERELDCGDFKIVFGSVSPNGNYLKDTPVSLLSLQERAKLW